MAKVLSAASDREATVCERRARAILAAVADAQLMARSPSDNSMRDELIEVITRRVCCQRNGRDEDAGATRATPWAAYGHGTQSKVSATTQLWWHRMCPLPSVHCAIEWNLGDWQEIAAIPTAAAKSGQSASGPGFDLGRNRTNGRFRVATAALRTATMGS